MNAVRIVRFLCGSVLAPMLCTGALSAQISTSELSAGARRVAVLGPYVGLFGSAVSADGRYLAYTDWTTGDLALFDLVAATHRRVTNKGPLRKVLEFAESFVRFSNDGRWVAYVWDRNGYELWTANIDGSSQRFVYRNAPGRGEVQVFDLSPGGESVVAVVPRARSDSQANPLQIALIQLRDGTIQPLKDLPLPSRIGAMAFSPDGQFIAYEITSAINPRQSDIHVLSVDRRYEIAIATDSGANRLVGWTPGGEGILFASDRGATRDAWFQAFSARASQQRPQRVLTNLPADFRPLGFTRDGALYYATSASSANDVFIATLDASRSTAVSPPSSVSGGTFANEGPDWSPDGRQVAFVRNGTSIVIHSIESGAVRELQPRGMQRIFTVASGDRYIRWSPDGRKMLVPENRTIFLVDVTTGDATPAITDRRSRFGRWAPDGDAIYYSRQPGANDSPFEIVRWKVRGDVKEVLYRSEWPGDNVGSLELSADGRWLAFSDVVVDTAGFERSVVRILEPDSGVARTLLIGEASEELRVVGWTPDANSVLITRYSRLVGDHSATVGIVPRSGGEVKALELDHSVLTHLRFHPDGRQFAFDSGRRGAEIWVVPDLRDRVTQGQPAHGVPPQRTPAAFTLSAPACVLSAEPENHRTQNVLVRSLSAVGSFLVGSFVGGAAGIGVHELWPSECGDDPGLCELFVGAAAGGFIGLTLGAAFPRLGRHCSLGRRFAWSVIGSIVGGSVGYAIGGQSRHWPAAATPAGVLAGAAIGADMCGSP